MSQSPESQTPSGPPPMPPQFPVSPPPPAIIRKRAVPRWLLIVGGIFALCLMISCVSVIAAAVNGSTKATATPAKTAIAAAPTAASASSAVAPLVAAQATAVPTVKPTDVPIVAKATNTPAPPTETATPRPPTATLTPRPPTNTSVPPTAVPTVAPAVPQQVTGQGSQAPSMQLKAGLTLFRLRYIGQSNYIIKLLDSNAQTVDLLVNKIGSFDGTKAVRVPAAGVYIFNVQASGPWIIDVLQPGAAELAQNVPLPHTFNDQGPRFTTFFTASTGALRLTLHYEGKSNFIVYLLNSQGQLVDLSANAIGSYDGSKVVRIPASGVYLFNVEAEGTWTIEATP